MIATYAAEMSCAALSLPTRATLSIRSPGLPQRYYRKDFLQEALTRRVSGTTRYRLYAYQRPDLFARRRVVLGESKRVCPLSNLVAQIT